MVVDGVLMLRMWLDVYFTELLPKVSILRHFAHRSAASDFARAEQDDPDSFNSVRFGN